MPSRSKYRTNFGDSQQSILPDVSRPGQGAGWWSVARRVVVWRSNSQAPDARPRAARARGAPLVHEWSSKRDATYVRRVSLADAEFGPRQQCRDQDIQDVLWTSERARGDKAGAFGEAQFRDDRLGGGQDRLRLAPEGCCTCAFGNCAVAEAGMCLAASAAPPSYSREQPLTRREPDADRLGTLSGATIRAATTMVEQQAESQSCGGQD